MSTIILPNAVLEESVYHGIARDPKLESWIEFNDLAYAEYDYFRSHLDPLGRLYTFSIQSMGRDSFDFWAELTPYGEEVKALVGAGFAVDIKGDKPKANPHATKHFWYARFYGPPSFRKWDFRDIVNILTQHDERGWVKRIQETFENFRTGLYYIDRHGKVTKQDTARFWQARLPSLLFGRSSYVFDQWDVVPDYIQASIAKAVASIDNWEDFTNGKRNVPKTIHLLHNVLDYAGNKLIVDQNLEVQLQHLSCGWITPTNHDLIVDCISDKIKIMDWRQLEDVKPKIDALPISLYKSLKTTFTLCYFRKVA